MIFPTSRLSWTLVGVVVTASALVFYFQPDLEDPRRFILALAVIAFVAAPGSDKPLRLFLWFPLVALVAWVGRDAATGDGSFGLWLWIAVAGACLVVRGGERASSYYLPQAGNEEGARQRRRLRIELLVSVGLFLTVFLLDGTASLEFPGRSLARGVLLFGSALAFLRYVLLQSKFLGMTVRPLLSGRDVQRLVPSQRWPVWILMMLVGATPLLPWLVDYLGEGADRALVLSAGLQILLASLLVALALPRLALGNGWPRGFVRRASFLTGMILALGMAMTIVQMDTVDGTRSHAAYPPAAAAGLETVFFVWSSFFLVVLPLMRERTPLFADTPRIECFIPSSLLAVMLTPVLAINGPRWGLTSTAFLCVIGGMILLYHTLVVFRERARGKLYLLASLAGLMVIAGVDYWSGFYGPESEHLIHATFAHARGPSWKFVAFAAGFLLYAVDFYERAIVGTES